QARHHAAGDKRPAPAAVPAVDRVEREGDAEEERRPGEGAGRERHEADDEQGRPDELVAAHDLTSGAVSGASTRTRVPAPGALSPACLPPSAATTSCIHVLTRCQD